MLTVPNLLSLLRLPLALLFLKEELNYRLFAIVFAMLSDGLDGFYARRYRQSSRVGTLLDPIMDRFFVFFVIGILLKENQLRIWEAATLLCRDCAVFLFGLYLVVKNKLSTYRFRAIWCGKVTTFLQFIVFFCLIKKIEIPKIFFSLFIILGFFALIELYLYPKNFKIWFLTKRKVPRFNDRK